jgi:hypothetical protein
MRKLLLLIAVGCLAASAACASAQAKSPADRPNLEVPQVPPRVIEARVVEPPPPEPVEELPPVAQVPPPKRPTPPPRDTAKADPKPQEPAPAAEQAPPVTAPVAPPVPQLRTPSTVDGAEATRQIHEVIERAKKGLAAIEPGRLSTERRQQYEQAKLMVTQSEDALKASNFETARNLADRADRLARELQGR